MIHISPLEAPSLSMASIVPVTCRYLWTWVWVLVFMCDNDLEWTMSVGWVAPYGIFVFVITDKMSLFLCLIFKSNALRQLHALCELQQFRATVVIWHCGIGFGIGGLPCLMCVTDRSTSVECRVISEGKNVGNEIHQTAQVDVEQSLPGCWVEYPSVVA